ncbi:ParB/RepB/Spo0J family partition protein [Acidobacteriota bacterium]
MKKIPLEDIDLSDQRFRVSYFFNLDQLSQSIREVGLIYPPVVSQRNDSIVPVTGWKRIFACKKLFLSPIPAYLSSETDDLKSFKLALFENLTTKKFDMIERAEIVCRLKKFGESEKNIIRRYLPLFGIPPTYDYYDLYSNISCLKRKEKSIVSEKNMALSVVEYLIQFSPKERKILFPILVFLSQNKQKELLELTREISLRTEIPVQEIFDSKEIKNVLLSDNLSSIQKADRVRFLLKEMRFPLLSSREKSFDSAKKKLGWPKDIDLSPTPYFEDNQAHIKFSFKGNKDYLKKISNLLSMSEKDEFSSLLKTILDE